MKFSGHSNIHQHYKKLKAWNFKWIRTKTHIFKIHQHYFPSKTLKTHPSTLHPFKNIKNTSINIKVFRGIKKTWECSLAWEAEQLVQEGIRHKWCNCTNSGVTVFYTMIRHTNAPRYNWDHNRGSPKTLKKLRQYCTEGLKGKIEICRSWY